MKSAIMIKFIIRRLAKICKHQLTSLKNRYRWRRFIPVESGFLDLFSHPHSIERLATGFQFTEGPVWSQEHQQLLFSDIPGDRIYQWSPQSSKVRVFREPSNHSNGLVRDSIGRLIACEHGTRRVTRTEIDGSITILADQFSDQPLNSPNDVVVAADGSLYFTDPPYGIRPQQQCQPTQGVYRIAPDGTLTQVVKDFDRPNGLAFSPDGKILYIDDSSRCHIRRFEVQDDGTLKGGEIFYDLRSPMAGVPDGMTVDPQGRLYCTGPGGIWVLTPGGEHLGTILMPEQPANCTWGDPDKRSLYVTARTSLYRIRLR